MSLRFRAAMSRASDLPLALRQCSGRAPPTILKENSYNEKTGFAPVNPDAVGLGSPFLLKQCGKRRAAAKTQDQGE